MNPPAKTRRAVILAAGEGKRLRPLTDRIPKCLVEVAGRSILENALRLLARGGVATTRIVVGHLASVVRERIGTSFDGMAIDYVENPAYAATNSMYSLHLGLDRISEATWVLEGDVYFGSGILDLPTTRPISWFVDAARKDLDGAYVRFDDTGRASALEIVRDLTRLSGQCGKSIGLLQLQPSGVAQVKRWLADGVAAGQANLYYDLIFGMRFPDADVGIVDVGGKKWFEIDNQSDLESATRMFS